MAKKYLDTKQSTIEASVLDVWAKSSEEQEAIRNAAEMMVQEKMTDAQRSAQIFATGGRTGEHQQARGRKSKGIIPVVKSGPHGIGATSRNPAQVRVSDHPQSGRKVRPYKAIPAGTWALGRPGAAAVQGKLSRAAGDPLAGIPEHPPGSGQYPRGKKARDIYVKQQQAKLGTGEKSLSALAGKEKSLNIPRKSKVGKAIKIWKKLTNGDFIGMTAYMNTLNEDQSSDQIEVIIGDINETTLTLIHPEDFDQTMSINLENLQVDINEDGELEFSEVVDWRKIPKWPTDKTGKPIPK